MGKHLPTIGEHLYLYTPCNHYYVAAVRNPYTVVAVDKAGCTVQAARPVFCGPRYYDTLADYIVEDRDGELIRLKWSEKRQRWQESPAGSYPRCAVFGKWDYYPYLD